MKWSSVVLRYSLRVVSREWRRFLLPFVSLTLTAATIAVILFLTASASEFLKDNSKALTGGDIAIESSFPIKEETLFGGVSVSPSAVSREVSFSGALRTQADTLSVSFRVIDEAFPLYGTLSLKEGQYAGLSASEILIDTAASERLSVAVGDTLFFGEAEYRVAGIIAQEPDALLGSFRFLPRVIMSSDGFVRSEVPPAFLRAEYTNRYIIEGLSGTDAEQLRDRAKGEGARVSVAGSGTSGFERGLQTVESFLVITVLVSAVLASVNVYASMLYVLARLQQSFAVLTALGLSRRRVLTILTLAFGYVMVGATLVGIALGYGLSAAVRDYAATAYGVALPAVITWVEIGVVMLMVMATGVTAVVPAWRNLALRSPRELLSGESSATESSVSPKVLILTLVSFIPLALLASLLLMSVWKGLATVGAVIVVYVIIAFVYALIIRALYRARASFGFGLRYVVAQKEQDGLFGMVAFSSLFIALTSLFVLMLTQASLQSFLESDLGRTIPSAYVINAQPAQKDILLQEFPALTLIPNVGGRIATIDGLDIQAELAKADSTIDRELGREYNLTYRDTLLPSEVIQEGVWQGSASGQISVDAEFADRANIKLGSKVSFLIQGFPLEGVVTSIRSSDRNSGLPFFYFVLAPKDLEQFPATFFGYANLDQDEQNRLESFIGRTMPNISVIDTAEIRTLAEGVVRTLLLIVFIITVPPLLLASLLIVALVVLQYGSRRRDGARLFALGAAKGFVEKFYVLETASTTILATMGAYLVSLIATWWLVYYVLDLKAMEFFQTEVLYSIAGVIVGVMLLGVFLWRSDGTSLKDTLSYEQNY